MKHQQIVNDLRDELAEFVTKIEGAGAMGLYDLAQISEGLMCGLLTHLLDLAGLRNLNADERKNFPGIDLADDGKRVAVQVTQSTSLGKITFVTGQTSFCGYPPMQGLARLICASPPVPVLAQTS